MEERIAQSAYHTLFSWTILPKAKTSDEVATREALRERYLKPFIMTQSQYRTMLIQQARGILAPASNLYRFSCPRSAARRREKHDYTLGA